MLTFALLPLINSVNTIAIMSTGNIDKSTSNPINAAFSPLMWGHTGEVWDKWLVFALVLTVIAAGGVAFATIGSVFAHKHEAEAAEVKIEHFKTDTAGKVADATTAGIAAGRDASDALAKSKGAEAKIADASAGAEKARAETATARAGLARSLATIETTKAQAADAVARAAEALVISSPYHRQANGRLFETLNHMVTPADQAGPIAPPSQWLRYRIPGDR